MKNIYGVTLYLLFATGFLSAQETELKFDGTIKDDAAAKVYLHRFDNKMFTLIDSADVMDGKFSFSTRVALPELYGLSVEGKNSTAYVFLDTGHNQINFDPEGHFRAPSLTGSNNHNVFLEYYTLDKPDITSFINRHPDAVATSYILYREWSYKLTPDELETQIALLSPQQQQSRYIVELQEIIKVARKVAIGEKAPEIVAMDTTGVEVRLYDNLGKYTLIEFWASWCPPCRQENPNLVKHYHQYKDQGFAIYAVSLDRRESSWIKAINDDGLEWTHVSDLKFWESNIAADYAVRAIPANFLVDEHGIIVAKNLREEELGKFLDQLF